MKEAKKLIPRTIEPEVRKWLDAKEIIAIRGPRQSGKTTLLNQLKDFLLKKKISTDRIHFISFEDDIEKGKFEKSPLDYIDFHTNGNKKNYFLFDEVQYIKNAGKLLKLIYDSKKNIKIIITGSSSLDLNKVGSYLVGRVLFFELNTFSFEEFLYAKDLKMHKYYMRNKFALDSTRFPNILFLDKLNELLKEYLTFGGYPRVVIEEDIEKKKFLLRNIYLTYVEKDIVQLYGLKYKQRILELIKYLASINSNIVNYNEASNITNLYHKEIKDLFGILEDTYIIKIISPFYRNLVTELRKNPKIYFIDTGLRNFIVDRFDFSDEEFGKLLENYVFKVYKNKNLKFWRTTAKAEVDFIATHKNNLIPIEVKITEKITRSFRSFIKEYKPKKGIIVNMKKLRKSKLDNSQIYSIPAGFI